MEKLEGKLNLHEYLDDSIIQHMIKSAKKKITHEYQIWELLPDELRQYVMVQIMAKTLRDSLKELFPAKNPPAGHSIDGGYFDNSGKPLNQDQSGTEVQGTDSK